MEQEQINPVTALLIHTDNQRTQLVKYQPSSSALLNVVLNGDANNSNESAMLRDINRLSANMSVQLATSFEFQISSINREQPEYLEMSVSLAILALTKSMNQKNSMDGDQIDECAQLIISKYWYLKPEEILLVFKMAKTGEFGTDFNRLDALTIFQWIDRYEGSTRAVWLEKKNKAMRPDNLVSQDQVLQNFANLMQQTIETGTNDQKKFLKAMSEAKEKKAKEGKNAEFAELYAKEYNLRKGKPDFSLEKFEAEMNKLKKKLKL